MKKKERKEAMEKKERQPKLPLYVLPGSQGLQSEPGPVHGQVFTAEEAELRHIGGLGAIADARLEVGGEEPQAALLEVLVEALLLHELESELHLRGFRLREFNSEGLGEGVRDERIRNVVEGGHGVSLGKIGKYLSKISSVSIKSHEACVNKYGHRKGVSIYTYI